MGEAENLQVSRNVWDAWNAHDVDRYLKLLGEKYVLECLGYSLWPR